MTVLSALISMLVGLLAHPMSDCELRTTQVDPVNVHTQWICR